ncbi:putative selection and upkeep of intraepithelial T-cells protein 1 homolog [Rousettus aegyptiacus]|uniref:putative selection and upkeep of intraepithelial T-cells protein 1 homolog n=1 Tax=Rousettus aegyptiacus TaxID=9407 RepID=UPI00168CCCFD|nr:putative selection and upkeep of intraepithelial T-cells protein 1 homolog [Rousettus aegyptiacus]
MRKPKSFSFSGWYVSLLLQVMIPMSENWTVNTTSGHLVAIVGGQAELSCHLSPPQSAKHMEVCWFKGDRSKLVHLFRGGQEVNEEAAPEYVDRTEFVKEAIGEGRLTLRLHNISVSDDGPYQCSFKDSDFHGVASMNLSVAALGLGTQIHIRAPSTDGLMVECNSGGWFPQPQMEWRDNNGKVVPHSSKSYSQDGAKLFHIEMTLLLRNRSQGNMTCYIRNPLIGEGKQTNIVIVDVQFFRVYTWLILFISVLCVMLFLIIVGLCCQCSKKKAFRCDFVHLLSKACAQVACWTCFCAVLISYLIFRIRVFISDPLFLLYERWIRDMAMVVFIFMVFYSALVLLLYIPMVKLIKQGTIRSRTKNTLCEMTEM